MSQPHVIRLRGPWLCWLGPDAETTVESAITVDCRDEDGLCRLPEPASQTRVLFRRRFHRPTGLASSTSVQLVVESSAQPMTLALNSRSLGVIDSGRHEFDISRELQLANQLSIEVAAESAQAFRALPDLFRCHLELSEGDRL